MAKTTEENTNEWKSNLSNWDTVSVEGLIFIFERGQEAIEASVNLSNRITNRAYTLISIYSTIIAILIGYFTSGFNKRINENLSIELLYIIIIVLFPISHNLIKLIRLISPFKIHYKGRHIREVLIPKFMDLPAKESLRAIIQNECDNSQVKLDFNEEQNSRRLKKLQGIIISTLIMLFATLLTIISIHLIKVYF